MPEPRIWVLPPEVAERIAAGEVVERPASVVKELVENALDAGARRVTVETEAGGKGLIRVTDDGQGMTPEEARIALQRHATSKLRSAEDLFNIHTLGFRGEALPSIAAVSELEILSRTPDATGGTRLRILGGVVQEQEEAPAQVGTTITVRRLFFNVPVREKFLRSDMAEANQITEWLQRLALSRPDVSFRLTHDGREALLSPGSQDPLNAVVAILGRAVARDLLRVGDGGRGTGDGVQGSDADNAARSTQHATPTHPHTHTPTQITVSGFVGRPTLTRANRALQHTYVNGRAVRSPLFYKALDEAFRSMMPQGRKAVAVLFIQVPPEAVDVNVHPAKTEVRFQDEWAVYGVMLKAMQAALRSDAGQAAAPDLDLDVPPVPETPPGSMRVGEPGAPRFEADLPETTPFSQAALGAAPPRERWRDPWTRGPGANPEPGYRWPAGREPANPSGPVRDPFADEDAPPEGEETAAGAQETVEDATSVEEEPVPGAISAAYAPSRDVIGELTLLGQVQEVFILAEGGGRFWIIDQHVAHERVLFDRMTSPDQVAEPPESLLIPTTLDVERAQALALDEHREVLAELGFAVEPFGPGRYVLRGVPRSLVGRNYEAVFRDLVDELAEQSRGGQVHLRREEVAMAAAGRSCKRAVKAGQRLSVPELEQLLADLRNARNPYTCPHGRPVFLTFEPEEVAGLFGGRTCDPGPE